MIKGILKYTFFCLLVIPNQLLAQEYNSSRQLENPYDRQEVRSTINRARDEIQEYCLTTNIPFSICFNLTRDKFNATYVDHYNKSPHWEFLRTCENESTTEDDMFLFNDFFSCFDNFIERFYLKTPQQDINHLFLLSNYENYFRTSFCRYNFSGGSSVRGDNNCRNDQASAYLLFKSLWFSSATNEQFYFSIENCLHKYKIKNNDNIVIDFHGIVNCIQN